MNTQNWIFTTHSPLYLIPFRYAHCETFYTKERRLVFDPQDIFWISDAHQNVMRGAAKSVQFQFAVLSSGLLEQLVCSKVVIFFLSPLYAMHLHINWVMFLIIPTLNSAKCLRCICFYLPPASGAQQLQSAQEKPAKYDVLHSHNFAILYLQAISRKQFWSKQGVGWR